MAAPSFSNAVRVRLHFDYPPPGTPGCRMCWLYIDLNKCRVVTDLASIIRDKFDFSRRTALDLFIEDCFLPPNESIYVIRDNDSIRVKAEGFLPALNGTEPSEPSPCKGQKRRRSVEDVPSERDHTKKSKKKKSSRETPDLTAQPEEGERSEHREKKKKKKKKTREESTEEEHSRRKKTEQKEKTSAADTGSRDGKKPSSSSVKSSAAPSPKPAAAAGKKPSWNRPAPASSHSSSTDSDSSEDQPASKKEQSKTPQSARAQPKPGTASGGGSAKRAPVPSKPVIMNASAPSKPVTARAASSSESSRECICPIKTSDCQGCFVVGVQQRGGQLGAERGGKGRACVVCVTARQRDSCPCSGEKQCTCPG
ncbi:UNVERIFIED_CONTAM: hypothetical protein FKN15_043481 [Acipenser sinensis]